MEPWFHKNMTGHELITVSPTGYTNSEINLRWLDHFIKYNSCGPDQEWNLLLFGRASSHTDDEFAIKCKANKIWSVMFPSHQTHLIQPAGVGVFRDGSIINRLKFGMQFDPTILSTTFNPSFETFLKSGTRPLPIRQSNIPSKTLRSSCKLQTSTEEDARDGKKNKKSGLDTFEFNSESEAETASLPVQQTTPPSNYDECYTALKSIESKIQQSLSSPSRVRYTTVTETTKAL